MTTNKKPKNYDDLYPGRFLKAGNFNGRKVTLTIKDYDLETLEGENGEKKAKAIIHFEETPRALVACKTNGLCFKAMFGADLTAWVGKKVFLYPAEWNGEPAIRVWGSPEIANDIDVEIKLPRRKPFRMVMRKTLPTDQKPADEDKAVGS
ncbi:hypothetical protein [Caudoviricetes sp.]|nr:hypothetical protein [Caudoviricetes sp.]